MNRTRHIEAHPGGSRAVLNWGGVLVNGATIAVEVRVDIRDDALQEATFTGSVASPAGCCIQSLSLIDLRTLQWSAAAGDRLFLPVMQGVVTDCVGLGVNACGAAHPELSGV
eukprot:SAG22_NODE_1368_length_4585_cov_2.663174_4_plen_112_part_00